MIDFTAINAFEKGKRDSFESLICVLAKREPPEDARAFQANDGRGGDGGVEALWILTNGNKVGYQSKFFETLGEPQWRQMDESVAQALKTHPELTKYVFALPFDLTADRGRRAKGMSQWEKWENRVATWKALAAKSSINIEFELWGATDLAEKVLRNENRALHKHWFGGEALDDAWFQRQVKSATQKLDDRFNPEDHVEVSIETMFDTIVRGPSVQRLLHEAFSGLAENPVSKIAFTTTSIVPDAEVLKAVQSDWDELFAMRSFIESDLTTDCNWPLAQEILARMQAAISKLEYPLHALERKGLDQKALNNLKVVSEGFKNLSAALETLVDLLSERDFLAEAARCAFVFGEAGAGKSHILGQAASQRVRTGLPTVVILGQDLSDAPFWPQLGGVLGIEGKTAEDILGVLNAVGERKGVRTLLLFDAINEGVGAAYWMHWLPEIVDELRQYPHIASVFSCRDVYSRYAIPERLLRSLPNFWVQGFATPEERERAAIQYLDKKGISRPNTPWLSPEFSNPLFLKSTSESLVEKGETEFPRGLHGISQLMALYLDGLSARMGVRSLRAEDLSSSLGNYVRSIAGRMADDGQDYVNISIANQCARDHFGDRQPPEGKTWLDVFIQANVFRLDPAPYSEAEIDPLNPPLELVRFSFQRFQNFLMAEALVEKVAAMKAANSTIKEPGLARRLCGIFQRFAGRDKQSVSSSEFQQSGPLNFIFYEGDSNGSIRYEYTGLVGALSTIYPEKLGVEFAKCLPNWEKHWDQDSPIQNGFGESFKWRRLDAFTDDTGDLLNLLDDYFVDRNGLLLEVSMTVGHQFNAERLHEHLKRFELAERDSHWTRWINGATRNELSQVDRIISWALSSLDHKTDKRHTQLASLVLAWSLSSSHMTLRDRATKALTTLFLKQSEVFDFVLDKMHDCDDPYIIERLYAAAFGVCCIDPNPNRLKSYSQSVFAKVFANGEPPVALLTRDYALGIIELAHSKNALDDRIKIVDCYHPFRSNAPVFDLTSEQVEEIADQRGGKAIFRSASSEDGDYGKYSIPGRVRNFLITPLSDPQPVSKREIREAFEKEVISPHPDRVAALEVYEDLSKRPVELIFRSLGEETEAEAVRLDEEIKQHEIAKERARTLLEGLLDDREKQRLIEEYLGERNGRDDYDRVNVHQCRLWITKRAYELGWTDELFPKDGHGSSYSRHHNDLERIGKKYQRIALDELQARLADNFWILEGWPESPRIYRYSEHDFRRNIEPTIPPSGSRIQPEPSPIVWIAEPKIELPEVPEADLKQWPFAEDPTAAISKKLVRIDESAKRWLVLYEYASAEEHYKERGPSGHGKRYEEFRFFYCVFLKKGKTIEFTEYLDGEQSLDVHSFQPRDFIDGPYLGEAFWRETWRSEKFAEYLWKAPAGCEFAIPVAKYHWESHLDKTLPDGFSNYMPQKWFADELSLNISPMGPQCWTDATGNLVIQALRPFEHQTAMVIDEAVLHAYAEEYQVEPVWLMIAERNTWPQGDNSESCWRRSESAIWFDGKHWQQIGWNKDTKR